MMRQDQSSPATDHRFSRIIGCSAFAPRKGEPSEPSVNPRKGAWVHRFPSPFQCFTPVVNPVNPYTPNKTLGDDTAAAGQRRGSLGRRRVSGGNIGKVGSLGSLGSPSDTSDHRFPPIIVSAVFPRSISPVYFPDGQKRAADGSWVSGLRGPGRGDAAQPIIGCERSLPPFDDGSFPRGGTRGDTDPRKNTLCKNFQIVRQHNVTL